MQPDQRLGSRVRQRDVWGKDGGKSGDKGAKAQLSAEAAAMQQLMRGIHFQPVVKRPALVAVAGDWGAPFRHHLCRAQCLARWEARTEWLKLIVSGKSTSRTGCPHQHSAPLQPASATSAPGSARRHFQHQLAKVFTAE